MKNEKNVPIGHNENPVEEYLIEKINRIQNLKKPWDKEEVLWQFEEVLFQLRKSNQSKLLI